MKPYKGEKLEKKTSEKEIYFYYDTELKVKQLSRVVFKKVDKEIHYPRGFEGGNKYKNIKSITFNDFNRKLPVGVFKSVNYGWGFAKALKIFGRYLDEDVKVKEVIISKNGTNGYDSTRKRLTLSAAGMIALNGALSTVLKKNKADTKLTIDTTIHGLIPAKFKKPVKTYTQNALAASINSWGNSIDEFSEQDKEAIKDLFDKLSVDTSFLNQDALSKTKEIVDNKYLQETLKKYKALMKAKKETKTVEKKWQTFLKENSWIFSSIFAQPVILYQDEAYVGGKTIDNKNGKFNDFLIKNSLSDNVSFLEIKTHKTALLEKSSYRGLDVYSVTKELTGATVQVLNQRDNFQKEYYQAIGKLKAKAKVGEVKLETFNSKCVVLIGSLGSLDSNQKYSFELYRSNSKDVEFLTFDELEIKIESLQKLLTEK